MAFCGNSKKLDELEHQCEQEKQHSSEYRRRLGDKQRQLKDVEDERRRLERSRGEQDQEIKRLRDRIEQVRHDEQMQLSQLQESLHQSQEAVDRINARQIQALEVSEAASQPGSPTVRTPKHVRDDGVLQVPAPGEAAAVLEIAEAEGLHDTNWRELQEREKQRLSEVQEELKSIRVTMDELKAKTYDENMAAQKAEEELVEKRRVVGESNVERETELKATGEKTARLQRAQDDMEREAKELQHQLRTAMYDVGKKDREKELKEAELLEVRQSIHTIQEEMDEVNRQLQAQCDRVQRVESSLRLSRDLGTKVNSMRDMLKESHSALNQLCGLVERERSQREQCSQGLRQQQMRTELLLQLLHHFKSRTQDLAPQVLLSQAAELVQGQVGGVADLQAAIDLQRSSNLSAVPPPATSRSRR